MPQIPIPPGNHPATEWHTQAPKMEQGWRDYEALPHPIRAVKSEAKQVYSTVVTQPIQDVKDTAHTGMIALWVVLAIVIIWKIPTRKRANS